MLTTKDRVKRALAIDIGDNDDLLEDIIKSVSRMVEDYCNRIFLYGEYTQVFDGDGRDIIFLQGFPVYEVKSVRVDGKDITSDCKVNKELGEIYYEDGFTEGFQNIEVVYTCGYDADDEEHLPPPDLEQAVVEEVVSRFENLTTQTRTGENLVDLRTNFLTGRARDYFSRQRNINV